MIRTQLTNGVRRVITKVVSGQRRVSCSCCETGCCMYSALGVSQGLITIEDLPDTVIYRGLIDGDKTFTKLNPPEEYAQYLAYYKTGSEPVGVDGDFIGISDFGDNWTNYVRGGINGIGLCLIESVDNTTGINDEFADNYTINFDFGGEDEFIIEEVTVFRRSLCRWDGLDSCGNTVELYFNPIDNSVEGQPQRLARWSIDFQTNVLREAGPCTGSEGFVLDKSPPHNSPVGEYGDFENNAGAKIE